MGNNWKNYYTDNAIHHITCTVHQWQPILLCPEILSRLYKEVNRLLLRWQVHLHGYVIMPEHFHLLAQSESGEYIMLFIRGIRRSISGTVMDLIKTQDAEFMNYCLTNGIDIRQFYLKTAGKSEFRFWKEKPRVFPITVQGEWERKLNYIHNNPVKRGLVNSPENWAYSSVRFYEMGEISKLPLGRQNVEDSIADA